MTFCFIKIIACVLVVFSFVLIGVFGQAEADRDFKFSFNCTDNNADCRQLANAGTNLTQNRNIRFFEVKDYTNGPPVEGPKDCSMRPSLLTDTGFAINSMSPWKWVINKHLNRIPVHILEAECLCDNCFYYADDYSEELTRNTKLISVPIQVETPVMYLKNSEWRPEVILINSGCRCDIVNESRG